jgi:phosphoglycolate phosphatase-like HAD superfamily hydrolase
MLSSSDTSTSEVAGKDEVPEVNKVLIVFDFDCTLSAVHMWKNIYGSRNLHFYPKDIHEEKPLEEYLTEISNFGRISAYSKRYSADLEVYKNFKIEKEFVPALTNYLFGSTRLLALKSFLTQLNNNDKITMVISTNGNTYEVKAVLEAADLLKYFSQIHGRNKGNRGMAIIYDNIENEYKRGNSVSKIDYMNELLFKNGYDNIIYVDDTIDEIRDTYRYQDLSKKLITVQIDKGGCDGGNRPGRRGITYDKNKEGKEVNDFKRIFKILKENLGLDVEYTKPMYQIFFDEVEKFKRGRNLLNTTNASDVGQSPRPAKSSGQAAKSSGQAAQSASSFGKLGQPTFSFGKLGQPTSYPGNEEYEASVSEDYDSVEVGRQLREAAAAAEGLTSVSGSGEKNERYPSTGKRPRTEPNQDGGGYFHKYMKYKTKYLQLKNRLNYY